MGAYYTLVNISKKEQIGFHHLPAIKAREIAGNPAASAIVAWYLLQNSGDRIGFVPDDVEEWPFEVGSYIESQTYKDVTAIYIDLLVEINILRDNGILWQDKEDKSMYYRDLRNAFMPKELL